MLTLKFSHICGTLAKKKIACWDAWNQAFSPFFNEEESIQILKDSKFNWEYDSILSKKNEWVEQEGRWQ